MQLTVHVSWIVVAAACLGVSAGVVIPMIYYVMIGKINERLPEGQRISYTWWSGTDVRRRFKQLYPRNRLSFLLDCCFGVSVICFILMVKFWVLA